MISNIRISKILYKHQGFKHQNFNFLYKCAVLFLARPWTPRALRHVPLTPIPATAGSALAKIAVSIYIPATAGN